MWLIIYFQSLEVVSRSRDPQLQVTENLADYLLALVLAIINPYNVLAQKLYYMQIEYI